MLNDAADEIDAPARSDTEHVITTIGWEPVQVNAKKVNQPQGHPEIGNGREKRQDWGHSSIVPGAALPGDQHTDQGTDEKAQYESRPDQAYAPGQPLSETIYDLRRKCRP